MDSRAHTAAGAAGFQQPAFASFVRIHHDDKISSHSLYGNVLFSGRGRRKKAIVAASAP